MGEKGKKKEREKKGEKENPSKHHRASPFCRLNASSLSSSILFPHGPVSAISNHDAKSLSLSRLRGAESPKGFSDAMSERERKRCLFSFLFARRCRRSFFSRFFVCFRRHLRFFFFTSDIFLFLLHFTHAAAFYCGASAAILLEISSRETVGTFCS